MPGNPEIVVISNITEERHAVEARRAGEYWHSDMCYTARPLRGTMLYAIEVAELHSLTLGAQSLPVRKRRGKHYLIRSATGLKGGVLRSISLVASAQFLSLRRRLIAIHQ